MFAADPGATATVNDPVRCNLQRILFDLEASKPIFNDNPKG